MTNPISQLAGRTNNIPANRKALLSGCAETIAHYQKITGIANLLFVCTHNSRRSQMAQIWAAAAAMQLGVQGCHFYSGGTEATAFNIRAVAAMERAGFIIETEMAVKPNPHYLVMIANNEPLVCFSKHYADAFNPSADVIAIMVCSDTDENCPAIPGAAHRISLPYVDPKASDDTAAEAATYSERCVQIGTEMLYLMQQVAALQNR